ncbi:hypothetical protein CKM354_000180900 [Cercospora kikuchii]|uniref:Uncharacterized protein n=1 Tax=Cercospora kikuchii TaxID=84275 RepID=A0A9P3CBB4_9PEZI|nr:uncharacterized protein CKM354_000180900 [Cercospora kikuchii]GIZ38391.1 hypothetical protein CKM354_000180900 [Cercospora kikuchii]
MRKLLKPAALLAVLPLLVAGGNPHRPYHPGINANNWEGLSSSHNGDKLDLKTWWEFGCSRQDAELGQYQLQSGRCKSFTHRFQSLLFEMPVRPEHPKPKDQTIWNCTLAIYEGEECNGNKLVTFEDRNKSTVESTNCLPAFMVDADDTDRVGRSVMVFCNGPTGYDLAIVKPFCEDPRLNPDGHTGLLAKGPYLNFRAQGKPGMKDKMDNLDLRNPFWEYDSQCKYDPFMDLEYNTTDYWNAKKHHDTDPYWWLKVHELGALTGCETWTEVFQYGWCGTPGTVISSCEQTKPQWPAVLPWKKDQKGNWLQPTAGSQNKYPPWPNDGYKACLRAYDQHQAVQSSQTSWNGPPYYSTYYASTFDWGTATGKVSGTERTRYYPYLKPTVSTIWDDKVDTSTWPTSWPTGVSTWTMPPTDATNKLSIAKNTHTRPPMKTIYSTVMVAPPTPTTTTQTALLPGTRVATMQNGDLILTMSTWSQTVTMAGSTAILDPAETSDVPPSWATFPEWSPTGKYRSLYPGFSEKWGKTSTKRTAWEPTPTLVAKYSTIIVPATTSS